MEMFLRPLRAASFLLQGQCTDCLVSRIERWAVWHRARFLHFQSPSHLWPEDMTALTQSMWWGRLQGWDMNCIHLIVGWFHMIPITSWVQMARSKIWWGSYLTLFTDFFCASVSKAQGILLLLMMNEADKHDLILAVIWIWKCGAVCPMIANYLFCSNHSITWTVLQAEV